MRVAGNLFVGLFILLQACSSGGDDSASDENSIDSDNPPLTEGAWYRPVALTSWQWQISGTVNQGYNVEVYDIDLFDSSVLLIQQLQTTNKKVICYFSAGSYENFRSDAAQFNLADLGSVLDGFADERWLDIRSENVMIIMKNRLDLAVAKGCDGVEPDNMDGYVNNSGFNLTENDQLNFNRAIANEAHKRNLSVGLKNDLDQFSGLVEYYDFAVNEQCFEFTECEVLNIFINKNKAVFSAEYKQQYVNDSNERNRICSQANDLKISTLILPLDLNDSFRFSCQ